jgi:acyl transferase domain-containing protein
MRELVAATRPDLLDLAVRAVGADPFERLADGTAYLQPAIYCASLASLGRLAGPPADLYAGHSMGEITALVAAGSISDEDGLRLVAARGRLMQQAAEEGPEGAMLAVGTDAAAAAELSAEHGLVVANDNGPDQVVLSGDAAAIVAVRAEAKRRGLRAFRLPIKGAFHSPSLEPIVAEYREALDAVEIRPPAKPVFSCVTAAEFDDVRLRLAESLTHGVRWREVLLALHARGARTFVELGPGQVLTKLVGKTLEGVEARAADAEEPAYA